MKSKKQSGAKIVNMPTVISGTTEQVAEQVNTAFILPVLHEFKANDPASAKQFALFMVSQCIKNIGDICIDSDAEFMRLTGIIKQAIDATAQETMAKNVLMN